MSNISYRARAWIDTGKIGADEYPIRYGVQVRIGLRQWAHLAVGTRPMLFDTEEEAQAEIKRLEADPPARLVAAGALEETKT